MRSAAACWRGSAPCSTPNCSLKIYFALVSLPLRGTKPILVQQPLRDLDQVRAFLSGAGPTAFLDMPWMPLFLIVLFLFHPAIGVIATCGAAAIIAMTLLTEWQIEERDRKYRRKATPSDRSWRTRCARMRTSSVPLG